MGLGEYISWYQKKIGTYDKQLWERTVEQRILHGLTNVPRKTAKLKTELIDVDLVRGSSFSKAKPKHGLLTVTRLSILRLFLLPVYCRWWIQQTSPRVFSIFLLLYSLQLINMCLYIRYCSTLSEEDAAEQHVSASEVFVPGAMMMALSWIHSQIVSTHSGPSFEVSSRKHRRKRIKRRLVLPSRSRVLGSDSKSSQDTGSEKAGCAGESSGNKYGKRPLLRRSSSNPQRDVVWEASGRNLELENEKDELESSPIQDPSISSRQRVRLLEPREVINSEPRRETPLDDDGFESLCGNCSSEAGEAEELEVSNSQTVSNNKVYGRASLNWKSVPIHNKIHNTEPPENSTQPLLSHAKVEVPLVQVTQHKDLLRLPEEGCDSPDLECRRLSIEGSLEISDEQLSKTGKASPSIASNSSMEDSKASVKTLWRIHRCNSPDPSHADSDTDASESQYKNKSQQRERLLVRRGGPQALQLPYAHQQTVQLRQSLVESSFNSSCESEDEAEQFTPGTPGSCPVLTEGTTSAGEWMGITTNSEACSYSSELQSDSGQSNFRDSIEFNDHPFAWEFQLSSSMSLNPSCAASDRVSCTVWESRDVKKADLSVLDISSAIIARVEGMPENMDYFYVGVIMSIVIALLPSLCRLCDIYAGSEAVNVPHVPVTAMEFSGSLLCNLSDSLVLLRNTALGTSYWERALVLIALLERCVLSTLFFFLLAVAERTFKQRFLYAKLFSHLTSFRRARKSELPHFRLNKVRNIKTWLSVRSYLKKRGPQRSVDIIVSTAFLIALLLVSFLSVECLKDSTRLHSEYNLEALIWSLFLGVFLLRFMTLGTQINSKYRDLSVLITEQINLYLQIEQKPNKKEELMVANSVLKLAADLLKELESPFKISGLSANPYLYTITKVVILSALSGVLSEMLGFKLKLHKIKIK